jgi:hypothetical protein
VKLCSLVVKVGTSSLSKTMAGGMCIITTTAFTEKNVAICTVGSRVSRYTGDVLQSGGKSRNHVAS